MPPGDPPDPVASDPVASDPVASDVAAAKAALRRRRVASRAAMADDERERARGAIRAAVLARAATAGWRCVAAYEPLRTEPGSVALLEELDAAGFRVLVPITLADRDLDWARWRPAGTGAGLGTSAIGAADAVLVPAFAVGDDGLRLGRGGGSYDRALPRCSASAEVAALLFDGEREPSVPAQSWDRPVHAVVTPSGWAWLHRPESARRNTGVVGLG